MSPFSAVEKRKRLWDRVLARSAGFRRLRSRLWYEYVSRRLGDAPVPFLNYGYIPPGGYPPVALGPEDEPHRTAAQLYHHVAGAVDLSGKDVVEVSCGRGGGASFVMRSLRPRSMLGLDLAENAIAFCRRNRVKGLCFVQGDAEHLPLDDGSADVVLNIESSHCYGRMERFVAEVVRVLRPGGFLLFADLGDRKRMVCVRELFERLGLRLIKEEKLNAGVLEAMKRDSAAKSEMMRHYAPWYWRWAGKEFAGIEDSAIFRMLRSEEILYLYHVLQKRPDLPPIKRSRYNKKNLARKETSWAGFDSRRNRS